MKNILKRFMVTPNDEKEEIVELKDLALARNSLQDVLEKLDDRTYTREELAQTKNLLCELKDKIIGTNEDDIKKVLILDIIAEKGRHDLLKEEIINELPQIIASERKKDSEFFIKILNSGNEDERLRSNVNLSLATFFTMIFSINYFL